MIKAKQIINELKGLKDVVIPLKQHGLKQIPKEIGELSEAVSLVVSPDPISSGWTVYPPHSAFDAWIDAPPFRYVPKEITRLVNLKRLTLTTLGIKVLPKRLNRLKQLEFLDLTLNKLTISREVDKLCSLKHLKRLNLFGNRVAVEDIELLKRTLPELVIDIEKLIVEGDKPDFTI